MTKTSLRSYGKEIEVLIDRGQYDQALAHCRHILRYFPKHIDTYRLMAKAYLEASRYGDASDVFQRVLSSIPDDFVSHLGMSIIREDEGNLDAAIWHMERAFEIQPANVAIQSEMRRLYGRRDGIEPPRVRLTKGALARMYYKGELYQQAISELRAALTTDPSRTDLQVLLAQAYLQAGQKIEAAEVCSANLKKLPYCLEANRILAEIMAGTERAQDAAIYRQRAIAMNPYLGQVSPKAPRPEQVPDEAVLVEKLDLKAEPSSPASTQPQWAASLGVNIDASAQKKEEVPVWLSDLQGITQPPPNENEEVIPPEQKVSPFVMSAFAENPDLASLMQESSQTGQESSEELLPDWMKEAGWSPTKESSKEAEMGYSLGEATTPEEEGLARAEIPDWLKAIAPKEAFEKPKEPEEVDQRLLEALDSAAAPWLEETPPGDGDTIASWLEEKEVTPAPSRPDEEKGLPDWLVGGAALTAAGLAAAGHKEEEAIPTEQAPAPEPSVEVPEWLSEETAILSGAEVSKESTPPASLEGEMFAAETEASPWGETEEVEPAPAETVPDWLRALEPTGEEPEKTEPTDTNLPEWLAATAVVSEIDRSEEVPEEPAPEWLSALEPGEETAEAPATPEEEASAYAWLEELTAQQIPEEAAFPDASQEAEEMAGWEPKQREPGGEGIEGISTSEAAGLGAALGAAAIASSRPEEEIPEEEALPVGPFDEGEWVPESFEPEAAITSSLFGPEGETELTPEEVLPEWLRQANPEAAEMAVEGTPEEENNLPLWLRQMQAQESESMESLWTQPSAEELEPEAEADLSWLPKVTQEPRAMDEWLRTEAPAGEAEAPGEVVPFAEKFAEEEQKTGEEPVWLAEEFAEEEAPQIEKGELPAWLAGLAAGAAGAATGAMLDEEAEPEALEQEEIGEELAALSEVAPLDQDLERATLESLEAAPTTEEAFEIETTQELSEAEYEVPEWLKTLEKPAEVAGEAVLLGATPEEEKPPLEETEPVSESFPLEEAVFEEAIPAESVTKEEIETAEQPSLSDEDAAFAWLESLAVKQGATEALLFTEEERQEEPPEWVKQEAQEEAIETAEAQAALEPKEEVIEGPAVEGAIEEVTEPEEEAVLPDWLLAAAAAGAITAREKEPAISEETQPTKVVPPVEAEHAAAIGPVLGEEVEAAEVVAPAVESEVIEAEQPEAAGAVEYPASESDIDAAYAWLEGLAVRQGAEEALLLTPEERQEEAPEWVQMEAQQVAAQEATTTQEAAAVEPEPAAVEIEEEKEGEMDRAGSIEAGLAGLAAAALEAEAAPEEIIPPVLEETAFEVQPIEDMEAAQEELPELPDWLADLERGTRDLSLEKDWTPERAAFTQPLEKSEAEKPREAPKKEAPAVEPAIPEIARLDINKASLVELERLPGVGFVRAEALIEYRAVNGPFESMMDLENVDGFDPELVDTLRDYATILPHARESAPLEATSAGQVSLTNARQALHQGLLDEAVGIYQALMSDSNLLPEVVKDLNDALYRYPVDVSIWLTLGDAEMRSGQVQEALDAYTKAEELLR